MFPFLILHYLLFMYFQRSLSPLNPPQGGLQNKHFTVIAFQDLLCDYQIAPYLIILFRFANLTPH